MIGAFFHTVFFTPIYNLLIGFYNVIPGNDLGLAVIALTVLIRIVLYPLSLKSIRAQKEMQELQPKLEEIKKKYGKDKEKQAAETMKLYRQEKINPLSSCLPLLLQLPFLFALFQVLRSVTDNGSLETLYPFIANPGSIQEVGLFGLLNLSVASPIIAILAGLAQFWQGHMLVQRRPPVHNSATKDEDFSVIMNQQMTYVMPVVTVVIAWTFPAGVALYWFVSTLLLALQQWFMFHRDKKHDDPTRPTPALASGN